ncbi:peptidoglycan DD-metalloendopeptidase family protein [Brasilonema bromeliae]|uniref:Peptidase M23 n=1 Tax=Brasilonema bromeliae SPC951 TaxID=385972 RepID=A0ABX1P4J8_9CYAN|nr:peptidoglycan DD-metalloendopeptidase family protein [Brasilonema bromeliae]NMG19257.1 peptidase M23 [Brasilonema bromeliae SPC951]
MKRALKNRGRAELENTPGDDVPVEPIDTVNPKVNQCRMPTTAAMIGLAISMGATSLLVTRQSDQATAAEALGYQNTTSTIPASNNVEVKFASTKKLGSQAVSSVSLPETGTVVEPTAISQLTEQRAKWQVAANKVSVQTSPLVGIPNSLTTAQQSIAWEKNNFQQSRKQGVQRLSHADGIASVQTVSSPSAKPSTVEVNNTEEPEVNAQLKAQQEFARNQLQEKSDRLRKSLTQWQSEHTKDLSQLAATRLVQPMTVAGKMSQTSTITGTSQSNMTSDVSRARLVSKLKQESEAQVATVPAPTVPASTVVAPIAITQTATAVYEVKPGDTIGAIANDYGISVLELIKANNLNNPHQLQISQKLFIPVAENPTTAQPTVAMNKSAVAGSGSSNTRETTGNSLIADNRNITVPTSVVGNTQFLSYIQSTTTNLPENTITNSQASDSITSYYGVGGDSPMPQVVTEPQLAQIPTVTKTKQVKNNQRLRSLQLEIERLRQKYRSQEAGNTVVPDENEANDAPVTVPDPSRNDGAVPIAVPRPNNPAVQIPVSEQNKAGIPIPVPRPIAPNYVGKPGKPVFGANRRPTNEPINPEFLPNQAIVTPPTGIDASRALGPMQGRTVSPQLPPLAAVDRYLPRVLDENTPIPSSSSTAYMWPAKGTLTSGYGWRWGRMHKGIDIANSVGTPIYASADGVVEKAGWSSGGYGNFVDIRHLDGSMTRYGHNSKLLVQRGQQVHQGQIIASMGSTGFSTGPHSHFEIHPSGKDAVNPIALLSTARL